MIDTHAHIDTEVFEGDRDQMLERAFAAGMEAIIVPDIKPSTRPHLKSVVDSHRRLFRGVGIHPHHAGEVDHHDLDLVMQQSHEDKVVAIGEIGLDYYYDFCTPEIQKSYFREQLKIAKSRSLPVIIHNREADEDVLRILEEEQDGTLRGVLHCFSSGVDVLDRAIGLGMHVSFTGNITFARFTLHEVLHRVPRDRFMLETDSPYMTPVPHRGKRNEPAYVQLVAEKFSEITGMTLSDVLESTTATARRFFGLVVALLVITLGATAQPAAPDPDRYDVDSDYDVAYENYQVDSASWARLVKPRSFGFGISVGSNTITERRIYRQLYNRDLASGPTWRSDLDSTASFSYPSILSFGGTVALQASDRLMLEATYVNTRNDSKQKLYNLPIITTHIAEATMLYALNPYNKVNFIPQIGMAYAYTDDGVQTTSKLGIVGGIGAGVAIPTSFGTFYPMFNVRFNFMLGQDLKQVVRTEFVDEEDKAKAWYNASMTRPDPLAPNSGTAVYYDETKNRYSQDLADITTIYSIPRLTILFYPNF
ncbi:MAG: TatD family deoxyribonuclease [Candidatus Kapabacteria bacterium]|nr:TatD family deoxyribonuclease [Candidatus Kapabacteria bacterium]